MSTETQTPEARLAALLAEKEDLTAKLAQVEQWQNRLRQLGRGWHSIGEIEEAHRAIRDAKFPIYREKSSWQGAERIVLVDAKWITLRFDIADEYRVTKYRRKDGMEGQRQKHGNTIDVAKALQIWEAHLAAQKSA